MVVILPDCPDLAPRLIARTSGGTTPLVVDADVESFAGSAAIRPRWEESTIGVPTRSLGLSLFLPREPPQRAPEVEERWPAPSSRNERHDVAANCIATAVIVVSGKLAVQINRFHARGWRLVLAWPGGS